MKKRISELILTEEQLKLGISIKCDEDFIYIFDRDGNRRAIFSTTGVTTESLRAEVDKIMQGDPEEAASDESRD